MLIGSKVFHSYLSQHELTYLCGTPSQMQMIDFNLLKTLRTITVLGERFQKAHFKHIRNGFEGTIINAYGATEVTIYNIMEKLPLDCDYMSELGTPLAGTRFHIIDAMLRLVPCGAIGELCMMGNGVSSGYLNRAEETAEKFVKNPFRTSCEEKHGLFEIMYRTGDLARWTKNRKIDILGRNDSQVKSYFKFYAVAV